MKVSSSLLVIFLTFSCTPSKPDGQQATSDSLAHLDTPPTPPTVKPNLTLFGAVVLSVDTTNRNQFSVDIELRTAIPAERQFESFAEPGQQLRVFPSYKFNHEGAIDMHDERNKRLIEVRSKNAGDFLFGKIMMSNDSTWYLLDTELR